MADLVYPYSAAVSVAALLLLGAVILLAILIRKRRQRVDELEHSLSRLEQEYAALKTDLEQRAAGSERAAAQAEEILSEQRKILAERENDIAGLQEKCRQYQGQLLSSHNELMKTVEQRDTAKRETALCCERLEQQTGEQEALLDRLTEAEARAAQCDRFIQAFGTDAESFFSRPDAEPRLRRMAAEYLTMVYDASASYLEDKPRPALTEARRIRELKSETQEWIDRALRAEYDLAQRPLQVSEQLYLFDDTQEE